jgi:multidrug efflux system outer membrane protein
MNSWLKYIGIMVVLTTSCKVPQTAVNVGSKAIPDRFQTYADTNSVGNLSWRSYFGDPLLQALIDTALNNNLDKKVALERIQLANARLLGARGALLPTVSGNFAPALRRYGYYTMDGVGNATTDILPGKRVPENLPDFYIGLQTSWEIDVWKKLSNRKKAAYQQVLASMEGANFVQTRIVEEVALAYIELIALDNEKEILSETIRNQEEVLDVIRYQKEAGRANELVVQQFKAQQLNTQTLEREVYQQILEVENRMNVLLGRYPQPIVRNKELLFTELPTEIGTGVPVQVLNNRPDVKAAALEVQANRFDLEAARAEFLPSLTLTAGLGYQAFNPKYLLQTPTSLAYSLVGGLTAPLLNRKAIESRFSSAKSSQIMAIYEYQKALLTGYTEVVNELNRLRALYEISNLKTEQSQVLEASVETSNELYTSAKATYLEVLVAQQNAIQAKLEMVDSHRKQWMASVQLYKALGGGWK